MILLIQSCQHQADRIQQGVHAAGLPAFIAKGDVSVQSIMQYDCPVVILDMQLAHQQGLALCHSLRKAAPGLSIVMTCRKEQNDNRVLALELGADDVISLPAQAGELQARIRVQLRRISSKHGAPVKNDKLIEAGALCMNLRSHEAWLGHQRLALTATEFALLAYFARHPQQVLSRETLLQAVWDYHYAGYEHTVVSHINRLRAKLAVDTSVAAMLETVRGVGYRWNPHAVNAASPTHQTMATPETVSRCPEKRISQPHL